jgi:NADH:ubiquinone oxidoreductase subunit K
MHLCLLLYISYHYTNSQNLVLLQFVLFSISLCEISIRVSKLILIISLCEISIRVSKLILIISLCEIKGQLSKLTMKLFIFPLSFFPAHDFCDPNPCIQGIDNWRRLCNIVYLETLKCFCYSY